MNGTQRFVRRDYGNNHGYTLDGRKVPGVTTIIGILDKPALVNWAAEQSANFAGENWARLSEVPLMERVKQIKQARFATNRTATVKGTRIHSLAEKLQRTGDAGEVPAAIQPQVEAVARFLDDWDMESVLTEAPICHTGYRYAGTLDSIMHSPRLGTVLVDWKTGKGVYSETALQLAAYRHADLALVGREEIGPRGGVKTVWDEAPVPEVEGCYVAHVLPDSIEFMPMTVDEQVWTAFLYLREIYDLWIVRTDRRQPEFDSCVGRPIFPEDMPVIEKEIVHE